MKRCFLLVVALLCSAALVFAQAEEPQNPGRFPPGPGPGISQADPGTFPNSPGAFQNAERIKGEFGDIVSAIVP